jgi:pSer/pThr/pTyr-binding forkhead associated (FHA) protein
MDVRLLIKSKTEDQQQEVVLSGATQFVLGRGPSSAALLDGPGISREHVAVNLDRSHVFVTDLSVNGTWINGKRLTQHQKQRVVEDDVVEIPGYEFVFQLDQPAKVNPNGTSPGLQPAEETTAPQPRRGIFAVLPFFTVLDAVIVALAAVSILLVVYYFSFS